LLILLSLKRAATINYEKFMAITTKKHLFEVDNLQLSKDYHTIKTKPDSTPSFQEDEDEFELSGTVINTALALKKPVCPP
jgi:hypothetical protein